MQTDTDVSTQEKTDPETSVNTEQPIQTDEAIAPLPENVIEKNQKEVGLPETGEDKTNLITTGIVLASIAATITALGSFINKKN